MNVKEVIDFIAEAWNNVTITTIQNYWIKTGILPFTDENIDDNISNIGLDDIDMQESDSEEVEFALYDLPNADKIQEYL